MSLIKKFIFIILMVVFTSHANSDEVKKMGKHKDWETYVMTNEKGKVCFAQSKPILQAPKTDSRDSRLFISFRPGEKITNEMSINF